MKIRLAYVAVALGKSTNSFRNNPPSKNPIEGPKTDPPSMIPEGKTKRNTSDVKQALHVLW